MIIIMLLVMMITMSTGLYVFNTAEVSVNTDMIESTEVQTINEQFTMYEGRQLGSQVKALLSLVITNAGNNATDDERLLDIEYVPGDGPAVDYSLEYIESDISNVNISLISELKSKISNNHYYEVEIIYDDSTGLVNGIIINY